MRAEPYAVKALPVCHFLRLTNHLERKKKTMIVQNNIKHINRIGLAAAKAAANLLHVGF